MSNPTVDDVATTEKNSPGNSPTAFRPYIAPEANIREFTVLPLIFGVLLGMVFGASSLYLVLKVGLTVSASIPVAVISITLFRLLSKMGFRPATILENNIVQTAGSAGESIAFGVGVTMPAILILGFDLDWFRVTLVAVLGSVLGILMMIPLRRALIVREHGSLKYPEGTACAEVLKAGASEDSRTTKDPVGAGAELRAVPIFAGLGIGFAYYSVMKVLSAWKETPQKIFGAPFKGGSLSIEVNPALLGVGYIIGPAISCIMCGGGVLAYLVLIPAIKFFGDALSGPLAPGTIPISQMSPDQVRGAYVLYIGAGAVAAGGIISLFRSLPIIWSGIKEGIGMMNATKQGVASMLRTDRDLSFRAVALGVLALVVAIVFSPLLAASLVTKFIAALMIILFGFLFVTVSSRLTGQVGSSSNPVSGMTVATLLLTCLIFLILGWTGPGYFVAALSVGAIVCIAAANAGATSQDLKTGFLVGSTPRLQQIAILIGALASALVLGPILLTLNNRSTVYWPVAVESGGASDMRAPASALTQRERLQGRQAQSDTREYYVWHNTDEQMGPPGRYLVDDSGKPVYLVDPGINGTHRKLPDGTNVTKYDAPKATLMSYIIKGILSHKLPWALVLLGVMIAVVLELSGVPSLPFAVGVYLPLSSSTPILAGGAIRWLVDSYLRKKHRDANLTEEQLTAEGDKSAGVLLASGYIAGAAVAGIIVAFMMGVLDKVTQYFEDWATVHNQFFEGPYSDVLSLIPFAILMAMLYLTGRDLLFVGRRKAT